MRAGGVFQASGMPQDSSASALQSQADDAEEEEEAADSEEEEKENFLSNPAMAPCVIWHTPLRVKLAANLPMELRYPSALP